MKNFIQFEDSLDLTVDPKSINDLKDSAIKTKDGKKILRVELKATHSGKIINNRIYLPSRMRKGVNTWLEDYAKPVLTHHRKDEDAIGRVIHAEYFDTSNDTALKNSELFFNDSANIKKNMTLLDSFVKGRLSFMNEVKFMTDNINQKVLLDRKYQGLGYIMLTVNIADEEAQEKFLDGRYQTFSVAMSSNRAVCSNCKQDWAEEGRCDCEIGSIVDGAPCYMITGDLFYSEVSPVNKPADRHSNVVRLNFNDKVEEIELGDGTASPKVTLTLAHIDVNDEEEQVAKKKNTAVPENEETIQDQNEEATEAQDANVETEVSDNTETEETVDNTETTEETVEGEDASVEGEDAFTEEKLLARIFEDGELNDEELEAFWGLISKEVKDTETDFDDAKLSTEARKKLTKSQFCGPNRSFPVNDCAHVTAARRLIGRYKGEGSKEKILACVNRKAKALGCEEKKDAEEVQDNLNHGHMLRAVLSILEGDKYYANESVLDEAEQKGLQTILKRMANLVGKDGFNAAAAEEKLGLDNTTEDAYCDQIVALEEKIGELTDHLDVLRDEFNLRAQDLATLQDEIVEEKKKTRNAKEKYFQVLKSLNDNEVSELSFSDMETSAIDSEIERLTEKVDLTNLIDKLNNGMSRNPEGTVDDPTLMQDNHNSNEKRKATQKEMEDMKAESMIIAMKYGQVAARKWFNDKMSKFELSKPNTEQTEEE